MIEHQPTTAGKQAMAKALSYLRRAGYHTARLDRRGTRGAPVARDADFVLLGASGHSVVIGEVKRLHSTFPRARLFVAVDAVNTDLASKAYTAGAMVVAPNSAFVDAVRNAVPLGQTSGARPDAATLMASPVRHPIEEGVVAEFHDPRSGRLDATKVAAAYGISISALARALKITQSALSKRPTAASAQPGLRELEFVWATLISLLASEDRARAWLNTKRQDLKDRPLTLLLEGSARSLGNYIRSVVSGEPG